MTFEAFVIDVQEATYTVRNAANGAIYHNCHLCTMGVADWCISKDDYVLCKQTDMGHVYIIGEIKARPPSTKGFRIGANGSDEFVITEEGTLLHERGMNSTMISDDGYEATYQKVIINGLGTKIEITEDQVLITVGGSIPGDISTLTITPTEILVNAKTLLELSGNDGGYTLRGQETSEMLDELKSILTGFISKFNAHQHVVAGGGGGTASAIVPAMQQTSTPQKIYKRSTVVKSS